MPVETLTSPREDAASNPCIPGGGHRRRVGADAAPRAATAVADPYRDRFPGAAAQSAREDTARALARGDAPPLVASYDAMLLQANSLFSKQMPVDTLFSKANTKYGGQMGGGAMRRARTSRQSVARMQSPGPMATPVHAILREGRPLAHTTSARGCAHAPLAPGSGIHPTGQMTPRATSPSAKVPRKLMMYGTPSQRRANSPKRRAPGAAWNTPRERGAGLPAVNGAAALEAAVEPTAPMAPKPTHRHRHATIAVEALQDEDAEMQQEREKVTDRPALGSASRPKTPPHTAKARIVLSKENDPVALAAEKKAAALEKTRAEAKKAKADAQAAREAADAAKQARAAQIREKRDTARAGRDIAETQMAAAREAKASRERAEATTAASVEQEAVAAREAKELEERVALGKIAQEKSAVEKAAADQAREARESLEAAAERRKAAAATEAAATAAEYSRLLMEEEEADAAAAATAGVVRFDSKPEVSAPTPEPEPESEMVVNESSVASSASSEDALKLRLRKLEEGPGVESEDTSQHCVISPGSAAESWAAQSLDGIADTIDEEIDAVTRIQSAQRGRKEREKVRARKLELLEEKLGIADGVTEEQAAAAVKIQAMRRGQIGQREVRQKKREVRSASRIQSVHRGNVARKEVGDKRKELGAKIFAQILTYDADNNGYIDDSEFKIFLKATSQWGTDELYTDAEWEDSWPIVCEILDVEDEVLGMPMEAFVRYTEKYRKDALTSDLKALEGADLRTISLEPPEVDESAEGRRQALEMMAELEVQEREQEPEPEPECDRSKIAPLPFALRPREPEPEPEVGLTLELMDPNRKPRQKEKKPKAGKSSEEAVKLYNLAGSKMQAKEYSGAAELYTQAAQAGHARAAACHVAAGTCWHLRRFVTDDERNHTEAIEAYGLALEVEPENGRALRGRADSYRHMARWPEAKADLDALERVAPKLVGDLREQVEREFAEQEAASKKIQALRRGNEARKELDATRPPEEARKMKDLRGENSSSAEAKAAFELGNKHLQRGVFDLAAECYGRAIRLGYGRPSRCHNGAGLALSIMGQDDLALESFSAAIELDASDPRVYHNRAAVYKRLKKFKEAALDAAAASFMDPADETTKRLAAWLAAEDCAVKIQAVVRGRNGRRRAASRASSEATSNLDDVRGLSMMSSTAMFDRF